MHVSYCFPQLFGTIRIASIDDPDGSEINDYNNFSNFFRAFLVMIRYAMQYLFVIIIVEELSLPPSLPPSFLSLSLSLSLSFFLLSLSESPQERTGLT